MATVINFPGHVALRCNCSRPNCMFCDGGLYLCTRCGGAEGSLPTDCPGEPMLPEVQDAVYADCVDYRHGRGWIEGVCRAMGGDAHRFGSTKR